MDKDGDVEIGIDYDLICPECGVGNPRDAKECTICEKNLEETILFLEDDSFDLEITKDCIIEYRKKFWGEERTGKVNKYHIRKIKNIEFGSPISRFIFEYNGARKVLPLKKENLEKLIHILKTLK
ncbi:MAG: hypothetical protein FJ150_09330 [Euryarchaeota archaeon]|nr:hypothetical protein [Euryarchaeota archaeon]